MIVVFQEKQNEEDVGKVLMCSLKECIKRNPDKNKQTGMCLLENGIVNLLCIRIVVFIYLLCF
jgi:hypothetical protein